MTPVNPCLWARWPWVTDPNSTLPGWWNLGRDFCGATQTARSSNGRRAVVGSASAARMRLVARFACAGALFAALAGAPTVFGGASTAVTSPATANAPAQRGALYRTVLWELIDSSGDAAAIARPDSLTVTCTFNHSALGGVQYGARFHRLEIEVRNLDPFVPRFADDFPSYSRSGSAFVELHQPDRLAPVHIPGVTKSDSDWASEDGTFGTFFRWDYPETVSSEQLVHYTSLIEIKTWLAIPSWEPGGDPLPEPAASVTYRLATACDGPSFAGGRS